MDEKRFRDAESALFDAAGLVHRERWLELADPRRSRSSARGRRWGTRDLPARRADGRGNLGLWTMARCPEVRRRGPRSPPSCSPASTCSCSTSPPTTSTSPASTGSSASSTGLAGAVVVVSHDRAFLDRAVDRIVEIGEETPSRHRVRRRLERRTSRRGRWLAASSTRRTTSTAPSGPVLIDRARTATGVGGSRARAARRRSRTTPTRPNADFFVNRTEKQAAKVRATEKKLAQLEAVEKPWEGWQLHVTLAPKARSGDVVARLDGAVIERGRPARAKARRVPARARRPRDRLAGAGRGARAQRQRQDDAAPGAARARSRWPRGVVTSGRASSSARWTRAAACSRAPAAVLDTFLARTGYAVGEARSLLAKFALGPDHVAPGGRAPVTGRAQPGASSRC